MSPDPKQDQPAPPPSSAPVDDRLTAVEAEQKRQGGILERIEQALAGRKTPPASSSGDPAPDGKPIAELVREGVEQLRREEQDQADREADKQQRADHAARLAALEERPPSETAATPAGRLRSSLQRWGFGIDQPRK